ncbi:MAG: NAD(P)H-dependent oxidoreductase [Micrococcaceae bacterium]
MKTLVLVFHPDLTTSRANKALMQAASGHENVTIRDVYTTYPDENIDISAEQQVMEAHDRIVLQFPFYWYSSPSLTKKWEDAVLTYGWAYGTKGTALQGKELLIATTTGSTGYTPEGIKKYTVPELLRPFHATSNLIGTTYLEPFVVDGVANMSDEELQVQAGKYAKYITSEQLTAAEEH